MSTTVPPTAISTTMMSAPVDMSGWAAIRGIVAVGGIIANLIAFIGFCSKHNRWFPKPVRLILQYQVFMDLLACLTMLMMLIFPTAVVTGVMPIDMIFAAIWTFELLYYIPTYVSYGNMLLLAVERYLAVCQPEKYQTVSRKHMAAGIFISHLVYILLPLFANVYNMTAAMGMPIASMQVRYSWPVLIYDGFVWIVTYLAPLIAQVVLYILIICKWVTQTSPPVEDDVKTMTRGAIALATLNFLTFGFDGVVALMDTFGLRTYDPVSDPVLALLGVVLLINQAFRPTIHFSFLAEYRHMINMACCGFIDGGDGEGGENEGIPSGDEKKQPPDESPPVANIPRDAGHDNPAMDQANAEANAI